jgi:hypothetical protein
MVGNIDSAHLNDTGILYLIKTMGLWGLFIGIFFILRSHTGSKVKRCVFFDDFCVFDYDAHVWWRSIFDQDC